MLRTWNAVPGCNVMTSQQIQDGGRPPCDTMSGRTSVWVGVRGVIVGYCPGGLCPGIYLNCVSMRWKLTEQCETDCPLGVKLAASCLTAVLALVAGLYLRYVELLYQRLVLDVPSEAAHIPTMTTHAVYNSSSWFPSRIQTLFTTEGRGYQGDDYSDGQHM